MQLIMTVLGPVCVKLGLERQLTLVIGVASWVRKRHRFLQMFWPVTPWFLVVHLVSILVIGVRLQCV